MAPSWRAALVVLAGILPVLFFPSTAMAWGWVFCAFLMCLVDFFCAADPRGLSYQREVLGPIRADEETVSTVRISNPFARAVRVSVRDAWAPSLHPTPAHHSGVIPAREHMTVTTVLRPERRGSQQADYISVRLWGPLGLAARQISCAAPLVLEVLPEFRARKLLPSRLARLHELEGTTATTLRGPGTEFDSLREYVRGDDPRDIDWRASARASDLIVRTWRPERDRHIAIIVDTGRSGALLLGAAHTSTHQADLLDLGVAPRLDALIEAALLVGALAERAGDHVHLCALDRQIHAQISGTSGGAYLRQAAQAFSDVSPSLQPIDWSLVVSHVRSVLRHPGLVLILSDIPPAGSDPDFMEALSQLTQRHTVVVASARDPQLREVSADISDVSSVFVAAAASQVTHEMAEGCQDVRAAGAYVVDEDAGLVAARLADMYIALKKAGKI